ncbi:MAG: hypothetical protein IT385_08745 [Deltaproteobacteria bacterium]|nr:hypothetical protein [Deltaproteobacteria bacterium]
MGLPIALFVALLASRPGPAQTADMAAPAAPPALAPLVLPPITWRGPEVIDAAWRDVRKLAGDGARLVAIHKKGLLRWACPDLVDIQDPAWSAVTASGLAWKDTVRGRGWARPALARVLASAHAAWRVAHPTLALSVGDVSQAGCGQIDPGVLTRLVTGPELAPLHAAARPAAGRWASREIVGAGSQPDAERFPDPLAAMMIERELVAEGTLSDAPVALVRVRRYLARPTPSDAEIAALTKDLRAFVRAGEIALEQRGPGADGVMLFRAHVIDAARERQAVIVSTAKRGTRAEQLRDVRIGPWIPGRPGIFQGEERWLHEGGAWTAWQLVEEGAHATHMAGRDADLSFAHADPRHRFTEALDHVDLAATWDWFVALEEAGRLHGTPVDAIIVGPRIHRMLLAAIPDARRSKLVTERILKVVRHHDDHQHIRIREPKASLDAEARAALAP